MVLQEDPSVRRLRVCRGFLRPRTSVFQGCTVLPLLCEGVVRCCREALCRVSMASESFKYKPQASIDCWVALGQELGFSELSVLIYESGIDFRYQLGMCLDGLLLMPGHTDGDPRRAVSAQGGKFLV